MEVPWSHLLSKALLRFHWPLRLDLRRNCSCYWNSYSIATSWASITALQVAVMIATYWRSLNRSLVLTFASLQLLQTLQNLGSNSSWNFTFSARIVAIPQSCHHSPDCHLLLYCLLSFCCDFSYLPSSSWGYCCCSSDCLNQIYRASSLLLPFFCLLSISLSRNFSTIKISQKIVSFRFD